MLSFAFSYLLSSKLLLLIPVGFLIFLIFCTLVCFNAEADMKRERERKDQESKKNQKVEFISGRSQPGAALTAPKVGMPIAGDFSFFF